MLRLLTPRFTLSSFQESDWPFFLELRQNNAVMRYMAGIASEEDIRRVFGQRLLENNAFVIRLHVDETPLGDVGLRISKVNPAEADVGYSILPPAQGQGIASEALKAVCEYAFYQANVEALNAWVLAANAGSVRVLEKARFSRVQTLEKSFLLNDKYYDDWAFRLTKEDFARADG
ncbi:GNAT family N-acetyltransferase [Superficieibacter electus]|uniref:GNAT family N-acetyltransferase n=1 Tax=Superficieibacter electus TaxID=2022662 RepID=A0A2P5GWL0_9ENTR|nr:GNAT family N-acetyltransferase [Superficieibacter electus]POP47930.1 GNAT family N-acetyltransferase [Superficieibacter electus]POP50943.1 GNAT family N-acetyltransferase [Superficieibacter electus]